MSSIDGTIQGVKHLLKVIPIPPVRTFLMFTGVGCIGIFSETAIYQEQSAHEKGARNCRWTCSPNHLTALFFFKTLQIQSLYFLSIFPRAPLSTLCLSVGTWVLYRYGVSKNKNASWNHPSKLYPIVDGLICSLSVVAKIVISLAFGIFCGLPTHHKLLEFSKQHSYIRVPSSLVFTAIFATLGLGFTAFNTYRDWKRII
jgi:hypothetical protein